MSQHVFLVPGLYNSGPKHWQSHWEKMSGFTRIQQKDWETPACNDWTAAIEEAVMQEPGENIILVGHSLACVAIVRWAEKYNRIIKGALLVAPSDVDASSYPPGTSGFSPMSSFHLPFPSVVIASNNDEYVTMARAAAFARDWGSELIDAGELGHINSDSDLGNWPYGLDILQKLIQRADTTPTAG